MTRAKCVEVECPGCGAEIRVEVERERGILRRMGRSLALGCLALVGVTVVGVVLMGLAVVT